MYTIGQVAQMFDLPVSTLRYYDKEGLFPDLERRGNIRKFREREVDALRVIECLKKSGLEIKDIKKFMQWVSEGSASYEKRKALFEQRRAVVEEEIKAMERTLAMLKFKCWYYEQALEQGGEEGLKALLPDGLPEEIQGAYDRAHSD